MRGNRYQQFYINLNNPYPVLAIFGVVCELRHSHIVGVVIK